MHYLKIYILDQSIQKKHFINFEKGSTARLTHLRKAAVKRGEVDGGKALVAILVVSAPVKYF